MKGLGLSTHEGLMTAAGRHVLSVYTHGPCTESLVYGMRVGDSVHEVGPGGRWLGQGYSSYINADLIGMSVS